MEEFIAFDQRNQYQDKRLAKKYHLRHVPDVNKTQYLALAANNPREICVS